MLFKKGLLLPVLILLAGCSTMDSSSMEEAESPAETASSEETVTITTEASSSQEENLSGTEGDSGEIVVQEPDEELDLLLTALEEFEENLDAEGLISVLQENDSSTIEESILYADSLLANDQKEEALVILEEIIEQNPENNDLLYRQAMVDLSNRNTESVIRIAGRMEMNNAEDERSFILRGMCGLIERDYASAQSYYSRALNLNEDNPDALIGISTAYIRTEQYDKALENLNKAEPFFPNDPYLYSDRSLAKLAEEDVFGALDDINKAIELDPENPWHYLDRSRIYLIRMNDPERAIPDLERTLHYTPDNFIANVYLGGAYAQMDRINEAIPLYEKILSLRPDYIYAYRELGILYVMNEDWEKAARQLEAAISQSPEEESLYLLRVASMKMSGANAAGIELAQEYMYEMTRDSIYYFMMRFYAEPDSDFLIQSQMRNVTDEKERLKLLFYLALQYKINDEPQLAAAYFGEVADTNLQGIDESRMAGCFVNGFHD